MKDINWRSVDALRKRLGSNGKPMTWRAFAKETGVAVRTLYNWRKGGGKWDLAHAEFQRNCERLRRQVKL